MPKRIWTTKIEDHDANVEMETSWWSGKPTFKVDGENVETYKPVQVMKVGMATDYLFEYKSSKFQIRAVSNGFGNSMELAVNGISVKTGKPLGDAPVMPKWAWIFVVACAAIPVIDSVGMSPLVIGLVGAFGVLNLSSDKSRSLNMRVLYSLGVTILAWAAAIIVSGKIGNIFGLI